MKSSHPADARSASTHYAPSVPMTVYRELAAELRANQAVIDSLNSRNQQLLQQNQLLRQEIHNVVQATLSLGQVAGVARQAAGNSQGTSMNFPSAITPDTLAKLVRSEDQSEHLQQPPLQQSPLQQSPRAATATSHNRAPQAITRPAPQSPHRTPKSSKSQSPKSQSPKSQSHSDVRTAGRNQTQDAARESAKEMAREMARQIPKRQKQVAPKPRQPQNLRTAESVPKQPMMAQPAKRKLFTEQPNAYRSSVLDASENKEIGGIWLVLSIILIIVTAFGAGFLIMKPLLNDR